MTLSFVVSRDEEYVHLRLIDGRMAYDMGSREHHYLLLVLARRRLEDTAAGLPETSSGWVDLEEFAHDPSLSGARLNLHVFRIRKQVERFGLESTLVERRRRVRQIRVGIGRLSIVTV